MFGASFIFSADVAEGAVARGAFYEVTTVHEVVKNAALGAIWKGARATSGSVFLEVDF
jgi:hypothetical protein